MNYPLWFFHVNISLYLPIIRTFWYVYKGVTRTGSAVLPASGGSSKYYLATEAAPHDDW